ncbi:hypothetical protein ABBQ38_001083 [Trebouxia sp. C0009 RCD-2024]
MLPETPSTSPLASQIHTSEADSAAGPALSLALNNTIFNYSPAVHAGPAGHASTQAVFIAGHAPPAELAEPATIAVGHHAHHHQATMQPSQGSFAAPASPAAVAEFSFTNGFPATIVPAIIPPPVQPLTPGLISDSSPQAIPPQAAFNSSSNSSTSATKTNKSAAGDCSAAALDHTTASSPSLAASKSPSSTAAAAAPHQCKLATEFAFSTTPTQSVAQSQDTIPAIHHVLQQQQQQEIPKRPSKDNLFVARREGFTDIKKSGRRTEEEKARGVQRSPDSLLMKWGQHPSQLVASAEVSPVPTPTPIIAQSGVASYPLTTAGSSSDIGSSSDRKEQDLKATHEKSAKSTKSKEYRKKMRHRLVKCRKLLLAPRKLVGSCFCASPTAQT